MPPVRDRNDLFQRYLISAMAGIILLCGLLPNFFAYGPLLAGVIAAAVYMILRRRPISVPLPALATTFAVLLLAGVSLFWAVDPAEAGERVMKLAVLFAAGTLLISVFRVTGIGNAKRDVTFFSGLFVVWGGLLVMEFLLGFPLYRLTRALDIDATIQSWVLNNNVAAYSLLLFFSVALVRERTAGAAPQSIPILIILALTLALFLMTASQASQLALLCGGAVALAFPVNRRGGWFVLKAGVAGLVMLMPVLVLLLYSVWQPAGVYDLNDSLIGRAAAPHRMEIWAFVSQKILENPLYGFGIEAARSLTFDAPQVYHKSNTILHPHNMPLQAWLEFGFIGALLFAGVLLSIINIIQAAPIPARAKRLSLASLISWLVIACTAYGLWQGWWIGLTFLIISLWAGLFTGLARDKRSAL